jgi:lambda repressor-like predicted transcriptional regulator
MKKSMNVHYSNHSVRPEVSDFTKYDTLKFSLKKLYQKTEMIIGKILTEKLTKKCLCQNSKD